MIEEKNAIITGTSLSSADHGVLSSFIYLDYGGARQGFGGYCLHSQYWKNTEHNVAGLWIWRVMEIADVTEWDDLKGKTIRVRGDNSHIEAIGHIVKDEWFYPEKEFKELKNKPTE